MISYLRDRLIINILWGLMALFMLNLSVDTSDPMPNHIPEDLTINDQESIIEIILEQVLGFENAIKEYDDNDREEHNKKSNVKIELIAQKAFDCHINQASTSRFRQQFIDRKFDLIYGYHQLETPPPKI